MKKSVLALAMAFGVTSAFAQDLTSKKGEPILPEKGDWAISADANPFLNYVGNFFGKTNNNGAPSFNFLANQSLIMGKYFLDEKTALRAGINIGFNTQSATNMVNQDNPPTTAPVGTNAPVVADKSTITSTGIGITAGIERRKGKTRLQGYYGVEIGLYSGSQSQKNTYGNSLSNVGTGLGTSTTPNSTTWSNNNGTPIAGAVGPMVGSRVTQNTGSSSFSFGLRGFIGVEYFVLPKISLGGEFGWGLGMTMTGAGKTTSESLVGNAVTSQTVTGDKKSSNINLGTDNKNTFFGPSGTIRMNFYF